MARLDVAIPNGMVVYDSRTRLIRLRGLFIDYLDRRGRLRRQRHGARTG